MNHDSLTPEWLAGLNLVSALEHLEFDIGVQAAKLTMLQQRVGDLRAMIVQEKENDETDTERKRR